MAKPTPTSRIEKGMKVVRNTKARYAKQIKSMHAHKGVYRAIFNSFPDLGEVSITQGNVFCYLNNLTSFNDPTLTTILSNLMDIDGVKATRTTEFPSSLNRDFRFEYRYGEAWDEYIGIVVSAYVSKDSPTCRSELVSTEFQKVEKYKIVCD